MMNYNPLVSIQIPTYNQKQFIKEALDSALAQTYENLQIIVSDDCSTDYDIYDYLSDYLNNPKITIHRNEHNLGRVGNYRNTLYNLVRGDWFVNLDGDDYFTNKEFVKFAVSKILLAHDKVSMFQANTVTGKFKQRKINCTMLGDCFLIKGKDYMQIFDDYAGFTHGSVLYNTQQAKKCNFYEIDALDTDYFSYLRMLKENSIIFWKEKVYVWREHPLNETHSLNFEKAKVKFIEYDSLKLFFTDTPRSEKRILLNQIYYEIGICLLLTFHKQKFKLRDLLFVLKKMKLEYRLLKPFLFIIKEKIVPSKITIADEYSGQ